MAIKSESMTTRELHQVRKKMWDASMENHKGYINPETKLFDERFVERRNCPVCESQEHRPLFYKSGGEYEACSKCGMVFLNPVLKDDCLEDYYRKNHSVQSEIVELDSDFYKGLYTKGINLFSAKFSQPGSVLDVGCSSGTFLDLARGFGWKTIGLELNKIEAEYCRKKGHAIHSETIQKVKLAEKVDVITLWDVFEHIKDGANFLSSAKKLLNEGGGIFIQSPTSSSLAAKMLHEKCNMFDGLEHVNLYNKETLSQIAKRAGFRLVSYETVISEIGVMNNYLQYEDPYLGSSMERSVLINLLNEEWILSNNLGYKFQSLLVRDVT